VTPGYGTMCTGLSIVITKDGTENKLSSGIAGIQSTRSITTMDGAIKTATIKEIKGTDINIMTKKKDDQLIVLF
jgi:hypothetical protein